MVFFFSSMAFVCSKDFDIIHRGMPCSSSKGIATMKSHMIQVIPRPARLIYAPGTH